MALLLCGCSDLVKVGEPQTVMVTWNREVPTSCGQYTQVDGCTYRIGGYTSCSIVMPETATDYVIAHEFKHCFGWEHK